MKTKLTPQDINDVIVDEEYHRFPETTVTVCCLTLENGYNVIGKSATINTANFDEEIGNDVARADAVRQIWELEGYLLKTALSEIE
ncbi:MAG: Gp49 family protein [Pseudomonadota bacterium]|nr:Gp49 family protein [Pseudomonadota bacterium]